MELIAIRSAATRMRDALEKLRNELPEPMADFPKGACSDTTLLLGVYFTDRGFTGFERVSANRGRGKNWTSHAWLAKGELVVDITADQFDGNLGKVVVASPSLWHKQFDTHNYYPIYDFRTGEAPGDYNLNTLYSRLKSQLFG